MLTSLEEILDLLKKKKAQFILNRISHGPECLREQERESPTKNHFTFWVSPCIHSPTYASIHPLLHIKLNPTSRDSDVHINSNQNSFIHWWEWQRKSLVTQEGLGRFFKKKLNQWDIYECAPESKGFPAGSDGKEIACNVGDLGSIPGSGRPPGGGNGNPL